LSSPARPSVTPNAAPKVSSLPARRPFIAASSGGLYSGNSPAKAFEHTVSYLTGVLGHMGLKDVTVIRAEGVAMGPEARQDAIEKARRAIGEALTTKLAA
jgi:FMN-dependent NADH-azoreductase